MKSSIIWALVFSIAIGLGAPYAPFIGNFSAALANNNNTGTTVTDGTGTGTNQTTQQSSQTDTESLNNEGAQQAMMLGGAAIAAGAAMIAAGYASTPPNGALIGAGMALTAAGLAGILTGQGMQGTAADAGGQAVNMGPIGTGGPTNNGGSSNLGGAPTGTPIKFDDSLMRNNAQIGESFDKLKNSTGISADELAAGLNNGKTVGELLAGKNLKGIKSASQIDSQLSTATPLSSKEVAEKLGLSDADLAKLAKKSSGDENSYGVGGGSGGRSIASLGGGDLFSGDDSGKNNSASAGLLNNANGKVSDSLQAALDKNGITNRSIFEMVKSQYKKKTPMLFGVQQKYNNFSANPFGNLKPSDIEI